ncbi:hypothetical protein ACN20G_14640 [Streptomyces sp. BI20]|uniref:hypothetical protein n=1 Tax=Streptomyces sp. BI20 TaxID=3403460 RepID=UPI003C719DC0
MSRPDAEPPGAAPAGEAVMTLRVSRDGGRSWGPRWTVIPDRRAGSREYAPRWPPCRCPRCRSHSAAPPPPPDLTF